MTKYDGVRKVDACLNENVSVEKKKRGGGDLLIRIFASVLITAVPFCLKAIGGPTMRKAVDIVKSAVTYDVITGKETENTEIAFVELIKEYTQSGEDK